MQYARYDTVALLGLTPLAEILDRDIWNYLLTPQVRAELGPVTTYGEPKVKETTKGDFPGDEATNLNHHQLFCGSGCGCVRFPYLSTRHMTEHGALMIKRDSVKVLVECWVGDVMAGKGEKIFLAALRDRRFDGSRRANDSALLAYTYEDPRYHRQIHPDLKSCELSIYSFKSGSWIFDSTGEKEFDWFFKKPFSFRDKPELFRKYFDRAWNTKRAPGQYGAPIKDVSKLVFAGFERLAKEKGYDVLEAAVSHYHVAMWSKSKGFRFSFKCDAETMEQFGEGLKRINEQRVKDGLQKLTRTQESWVCVVQSLRPTDLIPDGLYLNGPLWPQDNITSPLLWMNKPLSEKASKLLVAPQDHCATK